MNFNFQESQISHSNGIIYYGKHKIWNVRDASVKNFTKPKNLTNSWELNKNKNIYLRLDEISYLLMKARGSSNLYSKVNNSSNYFTFSLFPLHKLPLPIESYPEFIASLEKSNFYGLKKLVIKPITEKLIKEFDYVITDIKHNLESVFTIEDIYSQTEVDNLIESTTIPESSKVLVLMKLSNSVSYYVAEKLKSKYPNLKVLPCTIFQVDQDHCLFDYKLLESWVV